MRKSLIDVFSLLKDHSNKTFTLFVVVTILTGMTFLLQPSVCEMVYGGYIYPIIRYLYDHSLAFTPFATVYIILPVSLIWLLKTLLSAHASITQRLLAFSKRVLILLFAFYWLWGFNYIRPNLKERLAMRIPEVDEQALICFFELNCAEAERLNHVITQPFDFTSSNVHHAVRQWFVSSGLEVFGNPPMRQLSPAGILLGTSTAGIFFPYSLEPHIDKGLHPLTKPVTMAHEWGHAYGVTDEGECNYLGAVACLHSHSPELQYSARLQVIRWLFYPLWRLGYEPDALRLTVGESVLKDLKDIRVHHDGFPEYFPTEWRNWLYNHYLKAQGVESGLDSYGEVVGMLMADFESFDGE